MPLYHDDWDDWYQTVDAEERVFDLRGLPNKQGNIATEGSPFDTMQLRAALDNARSLQRSITGDETNGVIAAPSGGHVHEEGYDSAMPWCQIESWRLPTIKAGGASASDPHKTGFIVSSTSYTDVLFVPFAVPIGQTLVVPVFYVKISNTNTLTVKFDFYAPTDLTTSVAGSELSIGTASIEKGVVSDPNGFDLSGIATAFSHRIVYLRVQAKVDTSTAILREVTVRFPYRSYRQKEDRTELNTTYLTSGGVPSAATLKQLFIDNPENLRKGIFGSEITQPSRSYAHDHGEQRGLPIKRHQFSLAFGPYNFDDSGASSGGTIGIPIPYPASGSFATTPKLLCSNLVQLNGQISNLVLYVAGYLSGSVNPRSVALTFELRAIGNDASSSGLGQAITASGTLTRTGDGLACVNGASFGTGLLTLGRVGQDRIYQFNVWCSQDLASTEAYRLTGICAIPRFAGTYTAANYLPEDNKFPAREEIPVIRIRENQELSNLLTAQLSTVTNQITREALGGVPGYLRDDSVNTSRAWRHKLREVHQHRGTYTDDITGDIIDDGAVIKRVLCATNYTRRQNRTATSETTYAADAYAPLGTLIHGSSISTVDWMVFENVVSIPQGLGSIDLYATLNVSGETDAQARLYCFVELFDEGSSTTNRAKSMTCASLEGTDNISGKTGLEVFCEVYPFDSSAFVRNRARIAQGLGLWTVDALKEANRTTNQMYYNAFRTTQPIKVKITPTYSGAHRLRVRFACQTGTRTTPLAGTYSSQVRLLNLLAVPSKGY